MKIIGFGMPRATLFVLLSLVILQKHSDAQQTNNAQAPILLPENHVMDSLLTRWVEPKYPISASSQRITGRVVVEFDTDKSGHILNTRIVESEPEGVFDDAVNATLTSWTVLPYRSTSCHADFPRSRLTVKFYFDDGRPTVTALRPVPLSDPTLKAKQAKSSEESNTGEPKSSQAKPRLRFTYRPEPSYPRRGAGERVYGDVVASYDVQPNGTVDNVKILFSSPSSEFGDAAEVAIRKWRMETVGGDLPGTTVTLCTPISFRPEKRR